jgi:hypothetical protein
MRTNCYEEMNSLIVKSLIKNSLINKLSIINIFIVNYEHRIGI